MYSAAMAGFTIDEIPRPSTLEGDAGAVFAELVAVQNAAEVAAYGIPEVATPPAELLPRYLDPHESCRFFVARVDGRIVGYAILQYLVEKPETGWHDLRVLAGFQGRGIGRALAAELDAASRELGQTGLIAYAAHRDAAGPTLTPPTGAGSIPAGDRGVRFLLAQGWTLEQVERGSRFALPGDPALLAAARADAEAHAHDYRVVSWAGVTPVQWREGMALLNTRMSTDAPSGNLPEPENVWDVDRLVSSEALILESPLQLIVSAVEHTPTGALAGMTTLVAPRDLGEPVSQWATIVLREHRGHRLGMLLKTANLQFLEQQVPGHPSVLTWNAEENRHMLSVNEAVGFVRIGSEGAWGKSLI